MKKKQSKKENALGVMLVLSEFWVLQEKVDMKVSAFSFVMLSAFSFMTNKKDCKPKIYSLLEER